MQHEFGTRVISFTQNNDGQEGPYIVLCKVVPSLPLGEKIADKRELNLFELSVTSERVPEAPLTSADFGCLGLRQHVRHFFSLETPFRGVMPLDEEERLAVTKEFKRVYDPIHGAQQTLKERVHSLREAMNAPKVDATVLSGMLYGSLLTSLNEGPQGVCESFLEKPHQWATHRMALHESEVIACGRLHNADETTAQIRYMAVSKSFLRKGIGSKILASLEEVAIENNNKIILIHAREASVGFYKKKGYELLEKSHLLFNEVQHYKMQKKI